MAKLKVPPFLLLLFSLILAASVIQGSRTSPEFHVASLQREAVHLQGMKLQGDKDENIYRDSRRLMIGSTRPICTYNECRGCKYRCRAEQVPVEGNDPINSAYHYRCVCHR
ncbi:EPIDERMAL PATTERNING FACTOR-like protein 9 [Syzygium oleosum]|uniref:EPIDERMAL PATTERNING FACTOR-like protein 9 n=1 Tax=Syzygium oleosum TaxID=219896 RepID=UPI0011D19448|nr:EPIDERMAL PATTERNING FACTOR-like protein 9 [Syzygium oleosum]